MSILDTFTFLFDSNADGLKKGADEAEAASKKLEDQVSQTGTAGTQAAAEIADSNADAAASFADVADAAGEANAAMGDGVAAVAAAGTATEGIATATGHATEAHKELGVAVVETGKAGEHAAEGMTHAHNKLAHAIDHVKEHAKEMTEQLIEHAFEVAAAFKAMFEVEKLVDNFFEQAERSDQLGEKAKSLGVAVEELDAWGQAVKHVGGTSEGFEESLRTVNLNLERIALTGHSRMLPFLQELHIGLKNADGSLKTSFQLLSALPEAIDKMPKAKSGAILRGIGLDEGTIRLMQAGGKEAEELVKRAKELGVVTKEDAEIAETFNREWMDVKQLFRQMTIEGDSFLLPMFTSILHIVEDVIVFLGEHKSLVVGFFIALTAGALYAAEAFGVLDFAIGILTSPITLVVAAVAALIAAFAFLYDDIVNFAEGNNSIIGELAKRWPIVGEAVHGLISIVEDVKEAFLEAFHDIVEWIGRIPEGFRQWEEILAHIEERVEQFADYVGSLFEGMPEDVGSAFSAINEIINGSFEIIKEVFVSGFQAGNVAINAMYEVFRAIFKLIADLVVDPEHAFQNFGETLLRIMHEVIGVFPQITAAFADVGKAFSSIGDGILKLWHEIADVISGTVGKIGGALSAAGGWLSKTAQMTLHPGAWIAGGNPAPDTLGAAQDHMAATQSPLLAQTPGSLAAGAKSSETTNHVTVNAPTTINTQSTDPAGIKQEFDRHLDSHLTNALNEYATGAF